MNLWHLSNTIFQWPNWPVCRSCWEFSLTGYALSDQKWVLGLTLLKLCPSDDNIAPHVFSHHIVGAIPYLESSQEPEENRAYLSIQMQPHRPGLTAQSYPFKGASSLHSRTTGFIFCLILAIRTAALVEPVRWTLFSISASVIYRLSNPPGLRFSPVKWKQCTHSPGDAEDEVISCMHSAWHTQTWYIHAWGCKRLTERYRDIESRKKWQLSENNDSRQTCGGLCEGN